MTHKYNIGDIFARRYLNEPYHIMIVELVEPENVPMYEILKLETGEYDFYAENYFTIFRKVA